MFKEKFMGKKYKNNALIWELILGLTIILNLFLKYLFIQVDLKVIYLILTITSVYSFIKIICVLVKKKWIKIIGIILSLYFGIVIIFASALSDSVEKKIIINDSNFNKSIMLVQKSVWLDSGKNYEVYVKKAFIFKKFIGSAFLKERYIKTEWKENKAILNFDESVITVDLLKEKMNAV